MSTIAIAQPRRLPGVPGVWVFVGADLMFFGLFFISFMYERSKDVALFERSRHALDIDFGGINTLILLTSSWFVVMALQAARRDRLQHAATLLAMAIGCGITFGVLKVIEYSGKLSAGISMLTNDFYMFYFILTGIHFGHVIGGTVVLMILFNKTRGGDYGSHNMVGLESGATYWHMVDLLWIFLFPLLYLVR